ncbi:hypothetical protein [Chitinophaga qingshengii]|uniref:ATP/GTP-binding protein n=1 Tax=Chitinophaga qingshengii TaxID=1569794 RepID=A0ABR7TPG7_9BACT|nr:hypothetical protein [Chitinophaga qingshengii]MBC9932375.1 hypothetical protein [Chitinophaga qingshengii]
MKKIRLLIPLLAAANIGFGQMKQLNKTSMKAPESVYIHGSNYYISDTGGDPTKKDGDGFIYKMNSQGAVSVFVSGLDSPKGLWQLHNILYTPDVDKVKGFDLATGKEVFTLDMSATGTSMLNDIAPMNDSTVFVSATDISKVYIVHLGKHPRYEELVFDNPVLGANGVIYDASRKRLYVCGFGSMGTPNGQIGYVDLTPSHKKFVLLTGRTGYYDGIALTKHNTLLVSDWVAFEKKGVILEIDLKTGKTTTVNKEPIPGPADFTLNPQGDIVTPAMMEGNVLQFSPEH